MDFVYWRRFNNSSGVVDYIKHLDLSSFEKALGRLCEVMEVYNADKTNLITRDSMIQRFEYTYSLALKMIKRYLSLNAVLSENIDTMTFNSMIRLANKMGLIASNLEKWDIYRQRRNMTLHTYNEEAANAVVAIMDDFSREAKFLLDKLKEKINLCLDWKQGTLSLL